jgi:hypothetical protein
MLCARLLKQPLDSSVEVINAEGRRRATTLDIAIAAI